MSQLEGRVIIRTQNCNFNIDHLPFSPKSRPKLAAVGRRACGLHKNPMLHLSYWELKPFHGFFPIRKLQFWVLTPPEAARGGGRGTTQRKEFRVRWGLLPQRDQAREGRGGELDAVCVI